LIALLLFLSLFLLFCLLLVSDALAEGMEKINSIKDWLRHFSVPVLAAACAFILGTLLCKTPLAGLVWAVVGWLTPGWIGLITAGRKKSTLRSDVKNIVTAAAGLYAAGQVTPDVVKAVARSIPEPLAGDFQSMIGRRNADQRASFPGMFEGLAARYDLPEFKAMASIVAASEHAGGPRAAAEGLKQLAASLRNRDRRLAERRKETLQPMMAAFVTIILTAVGFVLDITVLSPYYASGAGKIMLAAASLLILAMVATVSKALNPKDLLGGGS
jgi:tight adherence protein B